MAAKSAIDQTGVFSGPSAAGTIPRTALVQKMKAISTHKNIYLTAPGGYGKTIAAVQWLQAVRGKTVKTTAGEADNDPGVFYRRLAMALLQLRGKENTQASLAMLAPAGISFDKLLEIIRLLPEKSSRWYLLLDDLHVIKNEEIINNLLVIAQCMPSYICRCLVSRSEPTAALLETGLYEVITRDDLLFSAEEIEWLGIEKDRSLNPLQIRNLLDTTGGWAMYVSALLTGSIAGSGQQNEKQESKTPQTLTQYLDTRVWKLWDDETKKQLLSLAVPVELTPTLCSRLTGKEDGKKVLERLSKKENAFLSHTDKDTYRFHDIFREFLMERIDDFLGREETQQLNNNAAEWYYEQGDYYSGAAHYIRNRDHEGLNRCIAETIRYHENAVSLSVEVRLNFSKQYIENLSEAFITENPFLIVRSAAVAYNNGDTEKFLRYFDILHKKQLIIAAKYPELAITNAFFLLTDFRIPIRKYLKRLYNIKSIVSMLYKPKAEARVSSITQNLPFFHRSMRDFSEYYELREEDIKLVRAIFSTILGDSCEVMVNATIAGIYYEEGRLLDAMHHAHISYNACIDGMSPETIFSSYMILSAVLYAMGAFGEAENIMERMNDYIENKAQFLRPNFKALYTERAIRCGDMEAAREWLFVYTSRANRLPFYQICRHFTTLRSYIAVEDYPAAIAFGNRLQKLAADYVRPLDQIESSLLTAIALWKNKKKDEAVKTLEQAVSIAMPYGFVQLFINEGKEALPLLLELRERTKKSAELMPFVDRIIQAISNKHNLKSADEAAPKLTAQQRSVLQHLSENMTYSEIAAAVGIGRATVKYHVLLVYKALGVHDAQEAVMKAKMMGLLE